MSDPDVVVNVSALIVFCLMASFVYLGNDIVDIEADRAHPVKKIDL